MDFDSNLSELRRPNGHEHYAELCALFTSGSLTRQEEEQLSAHLFHCESCSRLLQTYCALAKTGVPLLAPLYQRAPAAVEQFMAPASAKAKLLERVQADRAKRAAQPAARGSKLVFASRIGPLLAAAAAVVLLATVAGFAYRLGQSSRVKTTQANSIPAGSAPQKNDEQTKGELSSLEERLQIENKEIQRLEQDLKQQAALVSESKSTQDKLVHESQQQGSTIAGLDFDKAALAAERDALNHKLQESQNTLNAAQQRLEQLQEERNRQLLRTASLQARVDDLTANLKQAQEAVQRDEGFLASDRDIRELMGARDLYIADVFDIDREGKTRKPFGRVFYTGGKSLLFYAFDLDREPGVREASTFQVWGRRGPGDKRPLSMGILYQDNASNRRWVLRFDDPKILAEIDAVFVTVEPQGKAGQKPTGRQLLFASLRTPPNHP